MKKIKRGFEPRTTLCKDKDGSIISGIDKVNNRWVNYFAELLNPVDIQPTNELTIPQTPDDQFIEPPSIQEVEAAVKLLKTNKAPGIDNIPPELLKGRNNTTIRALHTVIKKVWQQEKMPEDWQKSIICSIHKKGDKLVCENYRGISLLCTSYKVFSKILEHRLKPYAENIVGEYQVGFRPGRSTIDQLFTVKQVLDKCWEYNVEVHQIFEDFKQAYDSVNRNALFRIMLQFGIPKNLSV